MLKPKTYPLLVQAVEEGVLHGYRRAHKHVDKPDEIFLVETIIACTMSSILEWFEIDPDNTAS